MLRVLSELLWSLRRDGLAISTAQSLDAARVVELIGFADRAALRAGLAAVIVSKSAERHVFRASFDDFFRLDRGHPGDLFDRLRGRGFGAAEIDALRQLLVAVARRSGEVAEAPAMRALTGSPHELDWLLRAARVQRAVRGLTSPAMTGFFTQRVADDLGFQRAASALARIRAALEESLGTERGATLAAALEDELAAIKRRIRAHVERRVTPLEDERAPAPGALDLPLSAIGEDEARDVSRAVRQLAEKLRGAARVRTRRARRGRIDPRRTVREAMRTCGVPMRLYRRQRRDERPKLVLLCDVSESVRGASRFMLEFVAATSTLFESARSFVFVSDVAETTGLFAEGGPEAALARIASGELLNLGASSNYERALGELERRLAGHIDKRTTLVILGDGRTNHRADGAEIVRRLRDRARAVVWLCPESIDRWGIGDSRMSRFREASTVVLPARTARELQEAARRLVRLR